MSAPRPPTGLSAKAGPLDANQAATQATLTWNDPNNSPITGYEIRYRLGTSTYGAWSAVSGSTATTTGTVVTGLATSSIYTFQVRANIDNLKGFEYSTRYITLKAPAAPANLTATAGDANVRLAWTEWNDHGRPIDAYQYRYKESTTTASYGDWTTAADPFGQRTMFSVSSLTNDTEYTFQVRAVKRAAVRRDFHRHLYPGPVAAGPGQGQRALPPSPTTRKPS